MASEPVRFSPRYRFSGDFELDAESYTLRHAGRVLKLERIPMEILLFLAAQRGRLVSRDQIVEKIWGQGVFLDTDNSINGAIRKIRQALKDDPEAPRFIETVSGKGYRFIAAVDSGERTPAPAAATETRDDRADRKERGPRVLLLGVALALAAALAGYAKWPGWRVRQAAPEGRVMLAVLPFENLTGDAGQDYISDGLTEEMITQLGRANPAHWGVIARTSVMLYKHNLEPLDEIGRRLGVQYVVEGSLRRNADQLRVTAQLIRVKDQTHVWAREYDRELKNLLELEGEIGQEIADEIQLTLGNQRKLKLAAHRTETAAPSYEAYDLYLRGLYVWNQRTTAGGFPRAAEYFQQAIALDHDYARAYAGLANAYGLQSTWNGGPPGELMPKARTAALKALQLDDSIAEAHAALALVAENYDYDWPTAEKEFRRAIELDPNYATAHQWYGEYLSWQGQFDEALAEGDRARGLDPLSLIIASDRGAILYRARQYDRAIAQFREVLALEPRFVQSTGYLMVSYIRTGRFNDALEVNNRYVRPLFPAWGAGNEAIVYGEWGRSAEAERALVKFEKISRKSPPDQYLKLNQYLKLRVYIGTGQKDQAIAILEEFLAEHSHIIPTLKTEPAYDPLRSDPRFQDLLRRVGLAE